jgi:hypothetical protein
LSSCEKDKSKDSDIISGAYSIEAHVVHHNWDVSGIMIYLEKDAETFPGRDSSVYDYKGQADGYGKFTFEKLHPGKYYLYASGYDETWGSNVIAEIPVILDNDHVSNFQAKILMIASE